VTALVIALVLVVLGVGGGATALALRSKSDYDSGNEVVPGVPTKAPASWGGAHTPEALLHRRLRAAVLAARAAATVGLGDARATIEETALAIDDRLIAAAALPHGHRETALAGLTGAVESLEHAVASMSVLPPGAAKPAALDVAVHDVQVRLDALAQARDEVERIDEGQQPSSDP
jgi:hypothetical protein